MRRLPDGGGTVTDRSVRASEGPLVRLNEAITPTAARPPELEEPDRAANVRRPRGLGAALKGETLLFFAKLMEMINFGDRSCQVIGFDNFAGFTKLHAEDRVEDGRVDKKPGRWSPANHYEELKLLINLFDHDRMAGQKPRIELVEGDVVETVPRFVKENPGVRIRLLHLDVDLYEPTLVALQHLCDKVVKGGIVILDEYAFREFPGEPKAVEEFFGDRQPVIRKFPFYSNPGGYFIK
jgi:hypothetical protein